MLQVVALAALWGPTTAAQAQTTGSFTMSAVKTTSPPTIDGVIDADEWRDATRVADFIQFEPNRGEPSEIETEAAVLYDDTHLYVAFVAHDPEPLMAQMTQRDAQLWNDDSVQISGSSQRSVQLRPVYMANKSSINSDLRGWRTPSVSGEELQTPGVRPTGDGGIARGLSVPRG